MFVTIIIIAIIVGILLAFILAPIIMIANKKKLKEMENVFEQYKEGEIDSKTAKYKMAEIKNKIQISDKKSLERARDLILLIDSN